MTRRSTRCVCPLVRRGVEARLTASGGTTEPFGTDASDECNQQDHRVAFIVAQ